MANLTETARWESGIYQLETTDPVVGGPDGISNRPARELGNRTAYLKQEVELRAPLASPALTGKPTAPTAAATENSAQLANTAWVVAALARLVDGAPETMATLNQIATIVQTLAPLASPVLTGEPMAPTAGAGTASGQVATTAFVARALAALALGSAATRDTGTGEQQLPSAGQILQQRVVGGLCTQTTLLERLVILEGSNNGVKFVNGSYDFTLPIAMPSTACTFLANDVGGGVYTMATSMQSPGVCRIYAKAPGDLTPNSVIGFRYICIGVK